MKAPEQTEKTGGKPRGRLWILAAVTVIGLGIGGLFLSRRKGPQERPGAINEEVALGCETSLVAAPSMTTFTS